MSHRVDITENSGAAHGSHLPVWAQDNNGLIANSDMLAIGATLLVVLVVKAAAMVWRR